MFAIRLTRKKPMHNRLLTLAAAGLLFCSQSLLAQQQISLSDAVSLTLKQHPDLAAFVHQQASANALTQQAGVAAPLSMSVNVEDAFGTGEFSGLSGMQTTLSIAWLLDDKLVDARVKSAASRSDLFVIKQQSKALDLAAETASLFITLLSQQEQLKLAKLAEHQAQKVLQEISVRVDAGRLNLVDQLRAQADLSKKSLVVEDLVHEIEASKAQLLAQWQGKQDFDAEGSLLALPELEDLSTLVSRIKARPGFAMFATQQRVLQSQITLALAENNPAWQVRTGVSRNEANDDFSLTAGITIPFGSEDRNRGKITSLQAQQNQQQAEAEAWFQRASTQVLLLTHKLKHNRHVVEGLSESTIPALQQANQQAQQAYAQGSYRYTDWYAVQQELLQAQNELINAYTNIQLLNIELERLTGASVTL